MNLAESRRLRLFTFGALFFAQGVPWGFMAITLPGYLGQRGLAAGDMASLIASTYFPYVFKWVWGPIIDSFTIARFGRRRPWIVLAMVMMSASVLAMVAVRDPVGDFDLLLVFVLVHTLFNAMQNVAVDGLAIDLLPTEERSRANGVMYGSKYAGGIVGAAGMAVVIKHAGFHLAIVCIAVIVAAISIVPILVRERSDMQHHDKGAAREIIDALRRVYRLRSPIVAAVLMFVQTIASGMISVVAPLLYTQDLKWDQEEYGVLTGGPGLAIGVVGSFSAAFFADKLGKRRLVALASLLVATGWFVFALNPQLWNTRPFVYTLMVLEPLTQSMFTVALWSVAMDCSIKRTAATQFAAYTSLMNAGTMFGSKIVAGYVTEWWTYQAIYIAAAVMQVATIALIPFIDPEQVRRELPAG